MHADERAPQFIRRSAVGALIAFDATVAFAIAASTVSSYSQNPRPFFVREPLLIWMPFAVAALATILLTAASGFAGAHLARRTGREAPSGALRILALVNIVVPLLLAVFHNPLMLTLLTPLVCASYLVVPSLALLLLGRRTGQSILLVNILVAIGAIVALLVLAYRFPQFGRDPNQDYTFGLYLPPQFAAALLLLPYVLLLGLACGVVCAVDGRLSGRRRWSNVFLIAVAAALLSTVLLLSQTHYPRLVPLSSLDQAVLAIVAGVAYVAMPILSLIYLFTARRSPPRTGLPGVGTVGTSL